jgi:hypothetical protein
MRPGRSISISDLPGGEIITKGLTDHAAGRRTPEACLVEMASPRLAAAGLLPFASSIADSELTLYQLLGETESDPDPLYNSLCRRLVSFERALDHLLRREHELSKN